MARYYTVKKLASEAGLDPDDVLVRLWDSDINYVEHIDHRIRKPDLDRARRAIGSATRRDLKSTEYWRMALGLNSIEFNALLEKLGIVLNSQAKRLPKGAVSKLKSQARRRDHTQTPIAVDDCKLANPQQKNDKLKWRTVGQLREIQFLNVTELREIHFALVDDFAKHSDPIHPAGVRSDDLLASAVFRPRTSLGNIAKYPTVEMAGAALLHAVVQDHPFHNGNKRTALVALLSFLEKNRFLLTCQGEDLFRIVLLTAQHGLSNTRKYSDLSDSEVLEISDWIYDNSRQTETRDRPLQWRRLRRILAHHGCRMWTATVGNRLNIMRTKEEPGIFGKKRKKTLQTQVYYGDEGRDADQNTIQKIRRDLHLDEENGGLDSSAFYQSAPYSPDDFIVKYRKTLKRLARL